MLCSVTSGHCNATGQRTDARHANSSILPQTYAQSTTASRPIWQTVRIECDGLGLLVRSLAKDRSRARRPAPGSTQENPPFPPATPRRVVDVTCRVFPAVVRLDVAQEIYAEGKRTVRRGIGSGVIIDEPGPHPHQLSRRGAAPPRFTSRSTARNGSTRSSSATTTGRTWPSCRWTRDELKEKKVEFRYAELGESKNLIPGQDVMAIGTPFGLARTMTLGVVSNNERTFYPERMRIDEFETGDFSNWIQMDTPINPGNSGGPLVDMTGKVVGINTRGGGQNLNFAVPIDTAKEVIAKILATATPDKKGRVDRSDLGIDLKPMQDLETFLQRRCRQGRAGQQRRPQLPGRESRRKAAGHPAGASTDGPPTCDFPRNLPRRER